MLSPFPGSRQQFFKDFFSAQRGFPAVGGKHGLIKPLSVLPVLTVLVRVLSCPDALTGLW
jgi:hypothetical protein